MSASRPPFVDEILLARPLPPLVPKGLSPTQNPVYSTEARSKIADLRCHPALESCVRVACALAWSIHRYRCRCVDRLEMICKNRTDMCLSFNSFHVSLNLSNSILRLYILPCRYL
jgi:hypothetical protein